MTDFTQYIIEKIAEDTYNKFTTVLENSVKPFPLKNCIYNKVIQAGYKDKDFYNITYKQLLKIKGIGKVKANEFLSSKKHYKLT